MTGPPPASARTRGTVEAIHVTPAAGRPMESRSEVTAHTGGGLDGDRYHLETGHWSPIRRRGDRLTLIEAEAVEAVVRDAGVPLAVGETRRNLTTRGIDLDALIGRRFRVGDTICLAVRRCEPCLYLTELLDRDVLEPLVHRGGIRVEIERGGTIRVGDPIEPLEPSDA